MNKDKNVWDEIYSNISDYTVVDSPNEYIYRRMYKVIGRYLHDDSRLLEAGCGTGYMLSKLQKKCQTCVGLDLNRKPIKIAKNIHKVNNLIRGDIFNLPFKNNSFDISWNDGVLEHFKPPKFMQACQEMARVSRKYVIIAVPGRYSIWVIRKFLFG